MANNYRAFNTSTNESLELLKKYIRPRPCHKKTETQEKVLQFIDKYKVVHLHGMSGSGKSEVVAGACEKLDEHPGKIIWHVQCKAEAGALGREGKEFARKLKIAGIISSEDETIVPRALNASSVDDMKKFLDMLNKNLDIPVLFVIEDIEDNDEVKVVKTMIECMMIQDASVLKIRLLIATQKEEVIYPAIDINSLEDYQTYRVKGFTKNEALKFLCDSGLPNQDNEKVEKLAHELSYSPLGLLMARSYCSKYRITYGKYYDSLGKSEDIEKEKELLRDCPDLGDHHRYEVIMKLLVPNDGNEEENRQFQVLQMMSFVSRSCIPTQLLTRFFQVTKSAMASEQKNATTDLVERLRREVDAIEWDVNGDEKLITLHGDILRALNASMELEEKREVLADVIMALGSLLGKDNRMKNDYLLLHSLGEHAVEVAQHCIEHFGKLFEKDRLEAKDYEILLGLSKLYEVIGFAMSQHPGFRSGNGEDDEDVFYQRAMECLWAIVCANDGKNRLFDFLHIKRRKGGSPRNLISYESGKNARETAQKVFDRMKKASSATKEISEALKNDWERLIVVKEFHLDDMQKRLKKETAGERDKNEIDWESMKQELKDNNRLSKKSRDQLEARHMMMAWKKFIDFYLADRMSSILHSRGRQDNYKGDIIPAERHVECQWYVEFGFQLCDIIYQKTGVKTIFHYILRANNQLPRLVRNRKEENVEEFLKRIKESRETAHSLVLEDADFFEHGIYKRISGTPWTVMNALKYLVKANTKVHKRLPVAKDFPISEADEECKKLYELCENNKSIVISTTCLVHVGKYRATRKKYAESLKTFESAFDWGINDKLQANPTTYAWALYNMGRTILAAHDKEKGNQEYIKIFNRRYNLLMKNEPPVKWKEILDDCKTEIDKLTGDSGRK